MKKLVFGLLLAATLGVAGVKTYPPQDASTGVAGAGGPRDSSLLNRLQAYYAWEGNLGPQTGDPSMMGYDSNAPHLFSLVGTVVPSHVTGKAGFGIKPDNNSGTGLSLTTIQLRQPGDFTVSAWVGTNGVAGCTNDGFNADTVGWGNGDGTNTGPSDYRMYGRSNGGNPPPRLRFEVTDSVAGSQNIELQLNDALYHNYVMIYTASSKTFKLYTDNVLSGTSGALTNGLRQGGTKFFTSPPAIALQCKLHVDEVAVWDKAATVTEVGCLWNGGSGAFFPFSGVCQ